LGLWLIFEDLDILVTAGFDSLYMLVNSWYSLVVCVLVCVCATLAPVLILIHWGKSVFQFKIFIWWYATVLASV